MKKLFISLAAIALATNLFGKPANPNPIVYTQPDGSKVMLRCRGDEYGLWVETVSNGDIVVRNDKGYFEYATIKNNEIVASGVRVRATTNGEALAAPKTLASRANMANLMTNQRENLMLQLDSIEQRELLKMDNQQQVVRKAKKKESTPISLSNPKVLCILIQFPDKPFKLKNPQQEFFNMWNQKGYKYSKDCKHPGSIKEYYLENSYGQMEVSATIVGPYTAKKPLKSIMGIVEFC